MQLRFVQEALPSSPSLYKSKILAAKFRALLRALPTSLAKRNVKEACVVQSPQQTQSRDPAGSSASTEQRGSFKSSHCTPAALGTCPHMGKAWSEWWHIPQTTGLQEKLLPANASPAHCLCVNQSTWSAATSAVKCCSRQSSTPHSPNLNILLLQ